MVLKAEVVRSCVNLTGRRASDPVSTKASGYATEFQINSSPLLRHAGGDPNGGATI